MAVNQTSNTKFLQVLLTEPNPDAGWYIEAYDKFNQNAQAIDFPVFDAQFKPVMNSIGTGSFNLPVDHPSIPDIISPENKVTSVMRVYIDGLMRYAFFADDLSYDYDEEGNKNIAMIAGLGMESVADRSIIGNKDHPASPSLNPTWIYGSTDNFVDNGGFEDSAVVLKNPGGEDGNTDDGQVEGWSQFGKDDLVEATGIFDAANARTDDWYIRIEALGNHTGISQTVKVEPNKVYHVQAYAKDPTAAGQRITLSLGGADDIAAIGITYPNNYAFQQKIYAELDNVARNPAGNGAPGGSTDGTWQVMDVEILTGDEQTSLEIAIQDDHHVSFTHVPFWIDDVTIDGWGIGLDPWTGFDKTAHATNSFQLVTSPALDGSYSCKINPLSSFAGIQQIVTLNPSTKYTANIKGFTSGVTAGDAWKLEVLENDGDESFIADSGDIVPTVSVWNDHEFVFTTPAATGSFEVILRFVYVGPNNPGPFYVDRATVVPGEPAAHASVILFDVIAAIQARDELLYLNTTFTVAKDSKGHDWINTLSLDIDPAETLYDLLSRMVALGHEWNIVPLNFDEGGESGFALNVYVSRGLNPESGIERNFELVNDGPVIHPTDATIGGRMGKSVNFPNKIIVSGDNGLWTQAFQDDFSSYEAGFGIITEYIKAASGVDQTTLAIYAAARLAELRDQEYAIQLNMQRSSSLRPFLDFGVGSSMLVDMPPYFLVADFQRVRAITGVLKGEGADITFIVDMSRVLYEQENVLFARIAQMSERAPSDSSSQGGGRIASGSGSVATTPVTPALTKHAHSLSSSEITDKTLTGDVSGTLNNPLTVRAIKGIPVDSDVPTDDGTQVVLIYNRSTKTFELQNASGSLGFSRYFLTGGM